MWDHRRLPWQVRSGGPGSGLYKSTDGGDTWTQLEEGLPEGLGKVAIDVSPANSEVVYANIEAEGKKAGVYRSDDAGETWRQTTSDRVTVLDRGTTSRYLPIRRMKTKFMSSMHRCLSL